jgi:hypothetical protein
LAQFWSTRADSSKPELGLATPAGLERFGHSVKLETCCRRLTEILGAGWDGTSTPLAAEQQQKRRPDLPGRRFMSHRKKLFYFFSYLANGR